jgi:hypothetical protein
LGAGERVGRVFASGESLDELVEALLEAIGLYVTPDGQEPGSIRSRVDGIELRVGSERELRPARAQASTGPLPAPPRSRAAHREWGPPRFRRR